MPPLRLRVSASKSSPTQAAPQSKRNSEYALESSVLPIPVAVGVSGGARKLPEKLRAGEVHRIIRGVQPGCLRQEIAGIHAHGELKLLERPGLRKRVLRPPHPSG